MSSGKYPIERWYYLGFAFSILVLFLVGFGFYRSTASIFETTAWTIHTHEVLSELELVLSALKDIETGQRGYVITEEEHFLQTYRSGITEVRRGTKKLRQLLADNRNEEQRLDLLEQLITRQLETAARVLEEHRKIRIRCRTEIDSRRWRAGSDGTGQAVDR